MKIKTNDGITLNVRDSQAGLDAESHEKEKKQPILFIHGMRQAQAVWDLQFQSSLANDYRLVSFDLRGHGFSDKPDGFENYTAEQWADDINSVIEGLGLERPIICAWSSGVTFFADYLAQYGDKNIGGIILIGPYSRGYQVAKPGNKEIDPKMYMDLASPEWEKRLHANLQFVSLLSELDLAEGIQYQLLGLNALASNDVSLALYRTRAADFSCEAIFRKTKGEYPRMVIYGEHDAFVAKCDAQADAKALGANFVAYPKIGHMPFVEVPDQFQSVLTTFVAKCKRQMLTQDEGYAGYQDSALMGNSHAHVESKPDATLLSGTENKPSLLSLRH